jgi:signal peptidase I
VKRCALTVSVLLAAGLVLQVRTRYLVITVDGPSMEPALRSGDLLLVRRTKRLRKGQIAVIAFPGGPTANRDPSQTSTVPMDRAEVDLAQGAAAKVPKPSAPVMKRREQLLVKRVVAMPGDRVSSTWGGPGLRDVSGMAVPPGSVVLLGDNRATSWDSRHYGFVRMDRFVGVVIRRLPHDRTRSGPGAAPRSRLWG